jgi:hypothetical protein
VNVNDAFKLGIEVQVRRVLKAMGEERILNGITAFETGASNWASCFFARAYPEERFYGSKQAEFRIAGLLGMGTNRVPMRIVYTLFDGIGELKTLGKNDLLKLIRGFLDEQRDPAMQNAIDNLLKAVDFVKATNEDAAPVWKDSCATDGSLAQRV